MLRNDADIYQYINDSLLELYKSEAGLSWELDGMIKELVHFEEEDTA